MPNKGFSLLIAILFTAYGIAHAEPASQTLFITNWSIIETNLERGADVDSNEISFEHNEVFKQIRASHDQQLFIEMTSWPQYPVVALAGFLCLRDEFPKQAISSAMRIILNQNVSSYVFYPSIVKFLNEQKDTAQLRDAFSHIENQWGADETNLLLLIDALPHDFLYKWFHSKKHSVHGYTFDAAILNSLYDDSSRDKHPVSKAMAASLDQMKSVPGLPRSTYLLLSDASKEEIMPPLKCALEDTNLPEYMIEPILLHREQCVRELFAKGLVLSEQRQKHIEKFFNRKKAVK